MTSFFNNSCQCPTHFVQSEHLSLHYFSNITDWKCQQKSSRKQRIDLKHWRQLMKKMYWAAAAVILIKHYNYDGVVMA